MNIQNMASCRKGRIYYSNILFLRLYFHEKIELISEKISNHLSRKISIFSTIWPVRLKNLRKYFQFFYSLYPFEVKYVATRDDKQCEISACLRRNK